MARFSWDVVQSEVRADLLQVIAPNLLSKYQYASLDTYLRVNLTILSLPSSMCATPISETPRCSTSIPASTRGSNIAGPSAPLRHEASSSGMDDLFGPDPNPSDSEPSVKALGKQKASASEPPRRKSQPDPNQSDARILNEDPMIMDDQQIKKILEGLREVGALAAEVDPSHPSPAIYDALKSSLASPRPGPTSPPMNTAQESSAKRKRPNVYATGRNQTGRVKWTAEEDRCLKDSMKELYDSGQRLAIWSTIISWHGESGTRTTKLMQRNPVALKDRARNIILKTRAQRQPVPDYMAWVKVNEPSGSGNGK